MITNALPPFLWFTVYTVHLRLIGKHTVDFLLVIAELLSLGVTAEALLAKINWKLAFSKEWGQFGSKFQVQGVIHHQRFFLSEKLDEWTFSII